MKFSPTVWWLIGGLGLLVIEFFTPFQVAGAVGIAAIGVAFLSLVIPWLPGQILLLVLMSGLLFWAARQYFTPKTYRDPLSRQDRARTVQAIVPGQLGRVSMGGTTWNARCTLPDVTIDPEQEVLVVGRDGNILNVMPMNLIQ